MLGGHQVRVKSWGRAEKRYGNRQWVIARDTEDSGIGARFIGMTLMSRGTASEDDLARL